MRTCECGAVIMDDEDWQKISVAAADLATFTTMSTNEAIWALQQAVIQERNNEISGSLELYMNDLSALIISERLEPRSFNNRGPKSYDKFIPETIGRKKRRK